jgi:D-alanyl-D-alanine carboxypeptidase/D-alanyl-D-alanine-endopeptidase (penicillin-binding protein 4)
MVKKFVFLLWGSLIFQSVFAQTAFSFKGEALQNAGCSVYIADAEDGVIIFETPQVSLVPASVMKVVTSAAALEILGPDFKFHTQLGMTGKINGEKGLLEGNLVIKGGCDPAFYSEYFSEHYKGTFETWAEALSKAGIKTVQGDLIVDLTALEGASAPGGWQWDDLGNYYGAGVSALTYSDNYYKIHFTTPAEPGKPVIINSIEPAMDSLKLINNVFSSDVNSDHSNIYGAPGSYTQLVEGTIPGGRSDFVVKASMPAPAGTAAIEFVKVLKNCGIVFSGRIICIDKRMDKEFTLLAEKSSPSLRELIVPLNQESLNLYAEHLLREIGRARKGFSSIDSSAVALKEFWIEKKVSLMGFYPTDGSGLSRSNGICPRTLGEILRYVYLSPNRDDFFNSLSVAGVNGTLQFTFKGTKLENNLRAKTGSMTRVKSLAGIFTNQSGRKIIFALIANNFEGTQTTVRGLIESFLMEIYESKIRTSKQ